MDTSMKPNTNVPCFQGKGHWPPSVGVVFSGRDDRFALSYLCPLLGLHNEPRDTSARQLARGSQGLWPWARAGLPAPLEPVPMSQVSLAPCSKQLSHHKNQQWLKPFCLQVKHIKSIWQQYLISHLKTSRSMGGEAAGRGCWEGIKGPWGPCLEIPPSNNKFDKRGEMQ